MYVLGASAGTMPRSEKGSSRGGLLRWRARFHALRDGFYIVFSEVLRRFPLELNGQLEQRGDVLANGLMGGFVTMPLPRVPKGLAVYLNASVGSEFSKY